MLNDKEIENLKNATAEIVEKKDPYEGMTKFKTANACRGQSFIDSGDIIKLFLEEDVFDEDNELQVSKQLAYNKMGHAMHDLHPTF